MGTRTASRLVTQRRVRSVRDGAIRDRGDDLAVEEPLEIRAAGPGQPFGRVAVTMRTPGHDFELAAGFLMSEGLVATDAVAGITYCEDPDVQRYNVVNVRTRTAFDIGAAERHFFASSSCGICGKAAIDAIEVRCDVLDPGDGPRVGADRLIGLPQLMRDRQPVFDRTGGLHAAMLATLDGEATLLREDVGRHNAVDKLIGARALGTAPAGGDVLVISGRLSFEIVQKAAVVGLPVIAALSAPTSLAVDTAEALGVTLVGFLRDGGFNVYTHAARIEGAV